jgi:hypothetical protein
MRNTADEVSGKDQNIHFTFSNFFPENCAFFKMIFKNVEEPHRPQMAV